MLRYVEIYLYRGEWIMFIVNTDTDEVEWCACNYRLFDDLCDDLEEIRGMMTLDELHFFKPTLKQDIDTLSANKELRMNADMIRRALWHKQNKYLHEISELFFEEPRKQDIRIIVYNNNTVNFSVVVLNRDNEPIWAHEGYRDFRRVAESIRRIQKLSDAGRDISRLVGCGIEYGDKLYPITYFFNSIKKYYEHMEYCALCGQIIRIEF